eukprot:3123874-Prymnesium_polylepis.1
MAPTQSYNGRVHCNSQTRRRHCRSRLPNASPPCARCRPSSPQARMLLPVVLLSDALRSVLCDAHTCRHTTVPPLNANKADGRVDVAKQLECAAPER